MFSTACTAAHVHHEHEEMAREMLHDVEVAVGVGGPRASADACCVKRLGVVGQVGGETRKRLSLFI